MTEKIEEKMGLVEQLNYFSDEIITQQEIQADLEDRLKEKEAELTEAIRENCQLKDRMELVKTWFKSQQEKKEEERREFSQNRIYWFVGSTGLFFLGWAVGMVL